MERNVSFMKGDAPMFSPAPAREAPARRVSHALGTMLRGETGFPQADVENDFLRARRRQVADRLAYSVRRRPGSASRLVPLDQVVDALGRRGERPLGLQAIRLAAIDARRDFDHRFRPTSDRVRSRWERLALAQRRGEPIPPIQVYRVGDLHFVEDGHHRVATWGSPARQHSCRTPGGNTIHILPADSGRRETAAIVPVHMHISAGHCCAPRTRLRAPSRADRRSAKRLRRFRRAYHASSLALSIEVYIRAHQ
jgi:hypothetical protein